MNVSLYIARRYLFAKKSHNAINIISLIAVCGVAIATMATVCTLSVFNGFQGLVASMFSAFDPELKILPATGKTFNPQTDIFLEIKNLPEVEVMAETLEDNVLLRYRNRQTPAVMKGVSDNFAQLVPIDSILFNGALHLRDEINPLTTLGVGIASVLGLQANVVFPIEFFAPKRQSEVNLANPTAAFNREYAYINDIFQVNQPAYDDNYVLVPLDFARRLLDYPDEVSALEIKLKAGANVDAVQRKIQSVVGENYLVKNRYEQQESAFRMIRIEKWVTFLMLCFILLIAAFNIIGSLSMLIVDKQKDIATLRNLGAGDRLISRIFLFEGWMISALGAVTGLVLGLLLCLGQQHFGWLQLGSSGMFSVEAYPVEIAAGDLAIVLLVVWLIGLVSVIYPSKLAVARGKS